MTFFVGVLLICFALRLWLASFGGIHPEEAYYWSWSQHWQIGYYDHPPMIAWLVGASRWLVTKLTSQDFAFESPALAAQIQLRALPMFLGSVLTPTFVGRAIEVAQKGPLRITQMMVLLSLPVLVWGPFMVTPDIPFLAAWSYVLLVSLRLRSATLTAGETTPFRPGLAVAMGVGLAFMAYSRHTALLAGVLVVVTGAGLANSVVAGITALALNAPYLLWLVTRGSGGDAGFGVYVAQVFSGSLAPANWRSVGDLWLSQIVLWTPFLFLGAFFRPLLPGRSRMPGRLWVWAFVPLFFFSLGALHQRIEASWPLAGLLAATVASLSGAYARPLRLWATIIVSWGLSLGFFLVVGQGPSVARSLRRAAPSFAARLDRPSKLEDFKDWDNLHAFLAEAVRSDERPVLVEGHRLLSSLLYQDGIAHRDLRFNDRLRIWSVGSRPSEFHRRDTGEVPQSYWLIVLPGRTEVPAGCVLRQTVYKGRTFPTAYRVYSCRSP